LLLGSCQAFAWADLKCVSGLPTTSFFLTESADSIVLTVMHHNDLDYIPVYHGVITPADVDMIVQRGEFFKKLGDYFQVHYPKENCVIEDTYYYRCHTKTPIEVNGQILDMTYFT